MRRIKIAASITSSILLIAIFQNCELSPGQSENNSTFSKLESFSDRAELTQKSYFNFMSQELGAPLVSLSGGTIPVFTTYPGPNDLILYPDPSLQGKYSFLVKAYPVDEPDQYCESSSSGGIDPNNGKFIIGFFGCTLLKAGKTYKVEVRILSNDQPSKIFAKEELRFKVN